MVIAEFEIKPGQVGAFLDAALDDVRHSVADEPGCQQFDAVRPQDPGTTVLFYEVYESGRLSTAISRRRTSPASTRRSRGSPLRNGWCVARSISA